MTPSSPKGELRSLPPTLRTFNHNSAKRCGKVPRGLRFPLEGSGLFTRKVGSPSLCLGQQESRVALHAGRQLSGKGLRYLKRVMVTPAV